MTTSQKKFDVFWNECLGLFLNIREMPIASFLQALVKIINNHQETIEKLLNDVHNDKKYSFGEAEKGYLNFVINIREEDFVIGAAKHDYERIVVRYQQCPPVSKIEAWRKISHLIWDLIVFVSQEVCPQCKSDHLCILMDSGGSKVYKSCETCFYTVSEDHQPQKREGLFPANLKILTDKGFVSK
jgi:hypothetical protein